MAISGGRIFAHYATIWAERYLLSLVLAIIDGHPSQALGLVAGDKVNHEHPLFLASAKQGPRHHDSGCLPRKAGDKPGDSLPAASVPTSTLHWSTMRHPKPSTAPSTSQGHEELAREDKDARGRSSSQGPQGQHRKDRSSTRGSRKCQQGVQSDSLMDEMSNYVALGWKRDLMYIIGCCWVAQVGPLDSEEWEVAIHKFLVVMRNRRAVEWMDIKELTPLQFMPYVADLFREVTGKDLQGLSRFTGWIGLGGYYHWKVAQLGLLHACPRLQGQPVPKGPVARPSG